MISRDRATPKKELKTLSNKEYQSLCESALETGDNAWSPKKESLTYPIVKKFKDEIKNYYFWHQNHRCCYCSSELFPNKKTYDAEHIIDKNKYPKFTFSLNNFGVSCVICNSHKSTKSVLANDADKLDNIPETSDKYIIVHPHLDEWSNHFIFDEDGLIRPIHTIGKGPNTISICGIESINFLKLSSKFSSDNRENAYNLMCSIISKKRVSKIKELLSLLEKLASDCPEARAVVDGLRKLKKIDHL